MNVSSIKLLLPLLLLLAACGGKTQQSNSELTEEQTKAFAALDLIQMSRESKGSLYSTFPRQVHDCFPPDTSFSLPQDRFLEALSYFLEKKCPSIPVEQRRTYAETAAKAQSEYMVLHCREDTYSKRYAESGTWVIPNMSGRRDLVMVW